MRDAARILTPPMSTIHVLWPPLFSLALLLACSDPVSETCRDGQVRIDDGSGLLVCAQACTEAPFLLDLIDGEPNVEGEPWTCFEGAIRDCSDVPTEEQPCVSCGCAAGLYCECDGLACAFEGEDGVCAPKKALGAECFGGYECESGNCSTPAFGEVGDIGRCQVPAGEPCTAEDCDTCVSVEDGPVCLKACYGPRDCSNDACLLGQVCALVACPGTRDSECPPSHECGFVEHFNGTRTWWCLPLESAYNR